LVSPVIIGEKSFIASGTVVRKDVSAGELVVDTREQKRKAGYGKTT
jgi:bifunctional N-acetylglucosamine-1-phosphate-uridyltransferase/glucosamine-1-phosphate-acetyltransferase GlmU-like protein